MKTIFGVEWFNKQEDFDEAFEKLNALLKDGEESEIVYIKEEDPINRTVIASGSFEPVHNSLEGKMIPVVRVDYPFLATHGISFSINSNKEKLLTT